MGRSRTFSEAKVIAQSAHAFRTTGYEGTSIDDLVQATGLHRGSLYKAFGSKRGIFVLAVRQCGGADVEVDDAADLLLIALIEMAPRDPEVRGVVLDILADASSPLTAQALGQRVLDRAQQRPTNIEVRKTPV
ncbi:MAG: TetR/AcrR family transcriptional regulator [Salinibacterium sp.]|nr:TetR/AcrR family transcriptional regulator [Salinibacterium sp.]